MVILDNLGIHTPKGSRLLRALQELGEQLILVSTPTYDPDANRYAASRGPAAEPPGALDALVRPGVVVPTDHNPNTRAAPTPLVNGAVISLPGHHAKVRRDGYIGHRRGGPA
jgi:hypothetical protein